MKVIIVGCGRVGSGLASQLSQEGHDVAIVDKDRQSFSRLASSYKGTMIEGIGFDHQVLLKAGVERADALAAVSSGDNTNIITARVAQKIFRVPRVVARLYDPRRAQIYRRLGLETVSTTSWGVQRVMQLILHGELNVLLSLDGGEVEIIEVEIPPHWIKRTVRHIDMPGEIRVAAISRQGNSFIPTLGAEFQPGDRLTLTVHTSARRRLESLLAVG